MTAKTSTERSAKSAAKRLAASEEELRLRVRPGTKAALADLMAWHGIEQAGEAMTLMIHHLHALGPSGSAPLLEVPRHVFEVPPSVALKLEQAYRRETLRICQDE
ncbi:hypothetical protein D3879_14920 [Pseudomonas cavernicola]|uniref:Uncharacterized protein n=1 Tax=Pseudomonas cavernicola TaxID=2320866 RepID=A0A418XF53_9PSED|nr:hypothetical protein [Pseudomonas cavernicola]RJG10968.1 hypothetical protein D3879_14920 [Pseudomonas cavernicola]